MNDGGPAFPAERWNGTQFEGLNPGMSLRDWFAGMALWQALSARAHDDGNYDYVSAANAAYQIADAMIAEREERK